MVFVSRGGALGAKGILKCPGEMGSACLVGVGNPQVLGVKLRFIFRRRRRRCCCCCWRYGRCLCASGYSCTFSQMASMGVCLGRGWSVHQSENERPSFLFFELLGSRLGCRALALCHSLPFLVRASLPVRGTYIAFHSFRPACAWVVCVSSYVSLFLD